MARYHFAGGAGGYVAPITGDGAAASKEFAHGRAVSRPVAGRQRADERRGTPGQRFGPALQMIVHLAISH